MKKYWVVAAYAAFLAACGGGSDSSSPSPAPVPAPAPAPAPEPTPEPQGCESYSDDTGDHHRCADATLIDTEAAGFVTFVGNNSAYTNSSTGAEQSQGPAPRLCALSHSQEQWHLVTPFGNFSVSDRESGLLSTFKPAFYQSIMGADATGYRQFILGDGDLMLVYAITDRNDGRVDRMATVTRGSTAETFVCQLDESAGDTPLPTPAPVPDVTALACTEGRGGRSSDGRALTGTASYDISDGVLALTPGTIDFTSSLYTATSRTGSLRLRMFATASNYTGGSIRGYVLGTFPLRFTNGTDQLQNGQSSQLNTQTARIENYPPTGSYCMVIVFEEYSSSCTQSENYCIKDWVQFGKPWNIGLTR